MKCVELSITFLWLTIYYSVSLSWSFSINSIFSTRILIPSTEGPTIELIESAANGIRTALDHCKNVFQWDRWNCPESAFSRPQKQLATREQAITHALVSAGLVYAITRNCSEIKGCGCNPTLQPHNVYLAYHGKKNGEKQKKSDWYWGGCSEDIAFGQKFAKAILDDLESGSDHITYVNLHNNLVGRTIMKSTMVKRCRCHGVSGSCSLQSCWMQMVPFSKVALMLKERYKRASKIEYENKNHITGNIARDNKINKITSNQLIFLQESPDYCISNNTTGWPGTKGRACSRTHLETASLAEKRSCRHLCRKCGYKVKKNKRFITTKCYCTFKWCCEVQCELCTENVEEFFCD